MTWQASVVAGAVAVSTGFVSTSVYRIFGKQSGATTGTVSRGRVVCLQVSLLLPSARRILGERFSIPIVVIGLTITTTGIVIASIRVIVVATTDCE